MIFRWHEPFGLQEWFRRSVSLMNLVFWVAMALVVASEFRFHWGERLLGIYLASTNSGRPETGAIWELGRDSVEASESLNQIISRRTDIRRFAHEAETFSRLFSLLVPGEWVILEKDQFKRLYRSLSLSHARQILEPARLIWLLNRDDTDRIFCEGHGDGVKIYFITAENRVIFHVDLNRDDLGAMERDRNRVPGPLEHFDGFAGRIHPVDRFFTAVFMLPPEMVQDLIPEPDLLLDQEGTLQRVGIWNEARAGFIRLGFEFYHQGEYYVLFARAREWTVWQLGLTLKGEPS